MVRLNLANLAQLEGVSTPSYDRSALSVGIVHFGLGNFHRSHEAMYVDRLMEAGAGDQWGICGVGLMPQDSAVRDVMDAQDCLYTLVIRHPDGALEPSVIGSVVDYVFAPEDAQSVFARLEDPAVRIASLTVTEGGYLKHPVTGEFDTGHPAVQHDLGHLDHPGTAFAFIVEGLRRRREAGVAPFTVLSCDNLQGNGGYARSAVVGFARLVDPALGQWIADHVSFPNCMVDRITPATTDADRTAVQGFGFEDRWPVPAEPFTQWIIEDEFSSGRPSLEQVGVQFVEDVTPYELMKLRLLNASHQAIAYLGAPLGYIYVDETMRDALIRDYLLAYMGAEAKPTLGVLPGIDLEDYIRTVIDRFSNPRISDTLLRLATDGANRMATFTLPAIRENLAADRSVALGAAMVAAWAQFWDAIGRGQAYPAGVPDDVHAPEMIATALAQATNPTAFIEMTDLFGDLGDDPRFRRDFLAAREGLARDGVHKELTRLLARN
jgi:mannitol 2-dehydrogenase